MPESTKTANPPQKQIPASQNGQHSNPADPLAPCTDNAVPTYLPARLVMEISERCVVAVPEHGHDGAMPFKIYAVDDNGLLNDSDLLAEYRIKAARRYLADCGKIDKDKKSEFARCTSHARDMLDAKSAANIALNAQGSMKDYPTAWRQVQIVSADAIDADLRYIGAPNGVFDLHTGKKLTPAQARSKLVKTKVPHPINLDAQDDLVDLALPPWSAGDNDPHLRTRQQALAWCFMKHPNREFFAEICAAGSGKTTTQDALVRAFGVYITKISNQHWQRPRYAGASDHSGQFLALGKPARICFTEELGGTLNIDRLKEVSGGAATIEVRQIHKAVESVKVTAHCWFMANSGEDGKPDKAAAAFNVHGDSAASQAMRDRSKMLIRERIPTNKQNPAAKNIGLVEVFGEARAVLMCQAVVARIFEYSMNALNDPLDPNSPTLQDGLKQAVRRETPVWETEFAEKILTPTTSFGTANSLLVWEAFETWWESQYGQSLWDDSGNKKPLRRTITNTVQRIHGIKNPPGEKIRGQTVAVYVDFDIVEIVDINNDGKNEPAPDEFYAPDGRRDPDPHRRCQRCGDLDCEPGSHDLDD